MHPRARQGIQVEGGDVMVKRILRKPGYPLDKQEQATKTVLEQAELMAERLAA